MDRVQSFAVNFAGKLLATIEAPTLSGCARMLGLTPCEEYRGDRCSPEMEPHAHLSAKMFHRDPVDIGGVLHWIAKIPEVGGVSYPFDKEHTEPPPVYLLDVLHLRPCARAPK